MIPSCNGSKPSVASSSSATTAHLTIPEDIRLKCSYYSNGIRSQVDALYEEQHKWLDDHLLSIKDTLTKVKLKKAGTRAVMAGIIKTPSRRRFKSVMAVEEGANPGKRLFTEIQSNSPSITLGELKRCYPNLGSPEIRSLIDFKAGARLREIEDRHKNDLLVLEKQYESPTKASDQTKPNPLLGGESLEKSILCASIDSTHSVNPTISQFSIDNHKSTSILQLERTYNIAENSKKNIDSHLSGMDNNPPDYEQPQDPELSHESTGSTSTGEDVEANDVYANNGHELSAIQEGEEEEDNAATRLSKSRSSLPESSNSKDGPHITLPHPPINSSEMLETIDQNTALDIPAVESNQSASMSSRQDRKSDVALLENQMKKPDYPDILQFDRKIDQVGPNKDTQFKMLQQVDSSIPSVEKLDSGDKDDSKSCQEAVFASSILPEVSTLQPNPTIKHQSSEEVSVRSIENSTREKLQPALDIVSSASPLPAVSKHQKFQSLVVMVPPTSELAASKPHLSTVASNSDPKPEIENYKSRTAESINQTTSLFQSRNDVPNSTSAKHLVHSSKGAEPFHLDSVIEVPLNDNPSSLRNNLNSSVSSNCASKASENDSQTPGPSARNFFTPGNTRAAMIQSPHSQWSSKPSNNLRGQIKPLNISVVSCLGKGEGQKSLISVLSSTEQTTQPIIQSNNSHLMNAASNPHPSASFRRISNNAEVTDFRTTSLKRTSADAGFPYSSETHEAKVPKFQTPAPSNPKTSMTGGAKRGMEDLKSRLSKIQRDSAMHERKQHSAPTALADTSVIIPQQLNVSLSHSSAFSKPLLPTEPLSALSSISSSASRAQSNLPLTKITSQTLDYFVVSENNVDQRETSQAKQNNVFPLPPVTQAKPTLETLTSSKQSKPPQISQASVGVLLPNLFNSAPTNPSTLSSDTQAVKVTEIKNSLEISLSASPTSSLTLSHAKKNKSSVDVKAQATKVENKHLAFLKGTTTPANSPPIFNRMEKAASPNLFSPGEATEAVTNENEDIGGCSSPRESVAENRKRVDTAEILSDNIEQHTNEDIVASSNEEAKESEDEDVRSEDEAEVIGDETHDEENSNKNELLGKLVNQNTPRAQQIGNSKVVPSSAVSSSGGLLSVFKAGAALASSWTTMKNKPEVKSLQLAAVAAKKEQEERERKAVLKEERRMAAAEKKRAEEASKAENERKLKVSEAEKKRQDREEALKSRNVAKSKAGAINSSAASAQSEAGKKRKVEAESNKIMEQKKIKPQQKQESRTVANTNNLKNSTSSFRPSRVAPAAPGSIKATSKIQNLQVTTSINNKSAASESSVNRPTIASLKTQQKPPRPPSQISQQSMLPKSTSLAPGSSTKSASSSGKGKTKEEYEVKEVDEYIELPDIDSEYSDDDESEHERKEAKLPDWAQSPALRQALENQKKVNPDDVFGGNIPPPKMDEIFRGKASRFRKRTSSANWTGADQLTALEEAEYVKRMGYLQKNSKQTKS
ncbi:hypothetical protein BY996DRAFT_4581634 [Phakopsora pachyrhizi]|nr:hypothetical protein BY996DRAFT_4581634 [Phakopsora pachyrhizi]